MNLWQTQYEWGVLHLRAALGEGMRGDQSSILLPIES